MALATSTVSETALGVMGEDVLYMLLPRSTASSSELKGVHFHTNFADLSSQDRYKLFPHQTGNASETLKRDKATGDFYCSSDCMKWNFGTVTNTNGTCCIQGMYVPPQCQPLDAKGHQPYCTELLHDNPSCECRASETNNPYSVPTQDQQPVQLQSETNPQSQEKQTN